MAKGKRKGKERNYPVGHSSNMQSTGHSGQQDDENINQQSTFVNATETASLRENENHRIASVPSTSSCSFQVPISKEATDDNTISSSSVSSASTSGTATATTNKISSEGFSTGKQRLPVKLPSGQLGRTIRLVSNLFPISLLPDGNIFHYDVNIRKWKAAKPSDSDPTVDQNKKYSCKNTRLNRELIQNMLDNNVHFRKYFAVYDGKSNLYAPSPLQLDFPYETKVFLEHESRDPELRKCFFIEINPVKKKSIDGDTCAINLSVLHELYRKKTPDADDVQEALLALETIFRHSPSLRYIPIGRNYYHPDINGMHPLSGGIQIWFGYHQSIRLGQWKPTINLNTSATTFFNEQNLVDYAALSCDIRRELPDWAISKLAGDLKNVKIETYHQGYKVKRCIVDVTELSARNLEFKFTDSGGTREITVLQYFREAYNINLKYSHLPCVQVKPKDKNIYLPLELCTIPEGEHCKKELSIEDKRKMIQSTADPPVRKFNKIIDIRNKRADYNNDASLNSFGIRVDPQPIRLSGRVLEAPTLTYSKNKTVKPTTGSWNIKNLEFYDGAYVATWTLLSLAPFKWCNDEDLEIFSSKLQQIGKAAGLNIGKPDSIRFASGYSNNETMHKAYKELVNIKRKKIQLTIVVIPKKDKFLYNNVKQVAEVELGLLTQCIDSNNAMRGDPSLLSNLCLKINAKMGGINHILTHTEIPQLMAKPTIIMGADVCHAGVADKTKISVASVTASLDMLLSRFAVVCRLQKNEKSRKKSVENIIELKEMVKTLLLAFYVHTKKQRPEKIIFFRDGVSDTQFQEIRKREVKAIREACMEIQDFKGYQPDITFITVQKRHHVRLRPENFRDGNVPPGTVVDTDIVHPAHSDFFLCSHQGIKGTSRPAHYTVLEDDSEFNADDLQKLTYYSCNNSSRCSKTISIPVPVHYADLAAYRTRSRFSTLPKDLIKKQEKSGKILKEILDATELACSIKDSMYFV